MFVSFDQIREQNRRDVDRSRELPPTVRRWVDAQVAILRASRYSQGDPAVEVVRCEQVGAAARG